MTRSSVGGPLEKVVKSMIQLQALILTIMGIDTKSTHITPVGGNVFADVGFEPTEAAELKAAAAKRIAERLLAMEVPDIACKKCGREIYCGVNSLCSDPECELKQHT